MLSEAYHWTLDTILWEMTLPQIIKYCQERGIRIERQNKQMEEQSRSSGESSRNRSRRVSDTEARKLLHVQEKKLREYEQRGAQGDSDAVPDISDIFSAFGSGFTR